MKPFKHILLILLMALSFISCNDNGKVNTSDLGFSQMKEQEDSLRLNDNEVYNEIRYSRLENRLKRNLASVNQRLAQINVQLNAEGKEFSSEARKTSEQLQKDLVRIKDNLQQRLSILRENTANQQLKENLSKGLEQTEDELIQIEEEIAEWLETHIEASE